MGTLAATISETYTQRYEALLRAANAIGTCSDCDTAADVLVKQLLEVVPFDYLQLVAFESSTMYPRRMLFWKIRRLGGYMNRSGLSLRRTGGRRRGSRNMGNF
jgi:hypothetical protein